jgi:hypothetical protein
VADIEIRGAKPLQRALRRLDDSTLRNGLTRIYREVAKRIRDRAKAAAPGRTGKSLGHKANQRGFSITVRGNPGHAKGTFFGGKGRFGWYAAPRYRGSKPRQFKPWLGNTWEPRDLYHIGPPIDRGLDDAADTIADEVERLAARAFQ